MTRAATAERRAELHRMLEEALAWPPEYASELSNHLPMALHALSELGASASRMRQFAGRYLQRFAGRGGGPRASTVADWLPLRGQADAYPGLRATFEDALAREGRDAVLHRVLPALWPGVAAAAFHGVIRTGHAAQAGHDGELAAALAYWAWRRDRGGRLVATTARREPRREARRPRHLAPHGSCRALWRVCGARRPTACRA